MLEISTSGLMSGDGKRGGASASVLAPVLDSTKRPADVAHALSGNHCSVLTRFVFLVEQHAVRVAWLV